MAKDVLCEVNSCRFWADQNKCTAASILIAINENKNKATNALETDCQTFEVK
ncbi:DUF1540 domain-containing protein [Paenibacillus apiarius]|uniref:DUF1540 domain-containing protein n=1 Tax=Paenibacillus apiarius TaxID=46240 RepID=A0ABT4DVY6_9BACL|nr:DUF1540 domain-containing protein [Paenibacillus apiarius]MBN3526693.1 DUF1540 domain-containing protein [Paenibacillus apiarius]MCY9513116.1 DUF1540 domain-containing protein [Paenibacillus apiarius]MCY9521526.1 DUF1540 domain-containing protein [Paenibacillus apiarius]MCY9551680.1 DUF1540 domain-containing protein [Paenibacillus apiarius]MCY9560532.1 DUF1540 domain-containing protein [Paenibacillus apiarius]